MISYIGLLKREKTVNPKIEEYVDVLDKKTQRLKILMEDLIEVSKINSGNFHIQPEQMDYQEFQQQVQGEFFEQLESRGLETVSSMPKERVYIRADGRALWRVMENLYGNIVKYALPGSRVYTDMRIEEGTEQLRQLELDGDYTARLALLEEQKCLPWQAIWEMYCQRHDTPAGSQWLDNVRAYENTVLSQRG